jgi:glycogen debranching enzyme
MNNFKSFLYLLGATLIISCTPSANQQLAQQISNNKTLEQVEQQAKKIISTGLNAGDGYAEVWIRDYNTFIEVAMLVQPDDVIQKNLDRFFLFQEEDGNIPDGFVEKEKITQGKFTYSPLVPGFGAYKNTVETDQEASLIQAVYKYIQQSGNTHYLHKKLAGKTVVERMSNALTFLMEKKYDTNYGLITGATTADWGDVQPEHEWGVFINDHTHYCIDIYDNAMTLLALNQFIALTQNDSAYAHWINRRNQLKQNTRKHLWNENKQQFIPHIYLKDSPFPDHFDESQIYYHGGTTVAIEAGLLTPKEVYTAYEKMKANVAAASAQSIGLTLYPCYPKGYFLNPGMGPYSYQNGGDWTWFGARTVSALIDYGYVKEAYEALQPMLDRVIKNKGFYEWYTVDGQPKGSGTFRGSAGVLYTAIQKLKQWSKKNR